MALECGNVGPGADVGPVRAQLWGRSGRRRGAHCDAIAAISEAADELRLTMRVDGVAAASEARPHMPPGGVLLECRQPPMLEHAQVAAVRTCIGCSSS
jgi:hypothetical protein